MEVLRQTIAHKEGEVKGLSTQLQTQEALRQRLLTQPLLATKPDPTQELEVEEGLQRLTEEVAELRVRLVEAEGEKQEAQRQMETAQLESRLLREFTIKLRAARQPPPLKPKPAVSRPPTVKPKPAVRKHVSMYVLMKFLQFQPECHVKSIVKLPTLTTMLYSFSGHINTELGIQSLKYKNSEANYTNTSMLNRIYFKQQWSCFASASTSVSLSLHVISLMTSSLVGGTQRRILHLLSVAPDR